jgi:hypothetical protein
VAVKYSYISYTMVLVTGNRFCVSTCRPRALSGKVIARHVYTLMRAMALQVSRIPDNLVVEFLASTFPSHLHVFQYFSLYLFGALVSMFGM